jgi:hypothetical protein
MILGEAEPAGGFFFSCCDPYLWDISDLDHAAAD